LERSEEEDEAVGEHGVILGSFFFDGILFLVLIIFLGGIIFGRLVEGLGVIKSSSEEGV
jgi:hypothetical protein